MRRRTIVPHWLIPIVFCSAAALGFMALDRRFAEVIAQAEAAGFPSLVGSSTSTSGDRPALGSEAVNLTTVQEGGSTEADGRRDVGERAVAAAVGEAVDQATQQVVLDGSVWVDPISSGRPWSDLGAVPGLLTFRGNPTRTFHGMGPVPLAPSVQWSVALGCSNSPVGSEPKTWCGSGWTGQPAVFRRPGGEDWMVAFGAYNRAVNFLDPASGTAAMLPYTTGDIIKGSVTADPDGFPLIYSGSRDGFFHVIALDRDAPQSLWKLSSEAVQPTLWNNDWDGSGLVIDDYLFIGGENSRFFIVKLNRDFGADGLVSVDPQIVFTTEGWDQQLLDDIGDRQVSVENSVAISGDTVYFANSGGLVQGWDVTGLQDGEIPQRTFRFWTGDDTDATIVVDVEGMLYVVSEYERGTKRSVDIGQIMKLDPSRPDDPLVWSRQAHDGLNSGVWATPAIHQDVLIVPTNEGQVLGLDLATGADLWQLDLPGPLWSSPVVVDNVLVQGDCAGVLHGFDVSAPRVTPRTLWQVELQGCIESTPAVWNGQIFVGSRNGWFYAIGDPRPEAPPEP